MPLFQAELSIWCWLGGTKNHNIETLNLRALNWKSLPLRPKIIIVITTALVHIIGDWWFFICLDSFSSTSLTFVCFTCFPDIHAWQSLSLAKKNFHEQFVETYKMSFNFIQVGLRWRQRVINSQKIFINYLPGEGFQCLFINNGW